LNARGEKMNLKQIRDERRRNRRNKEEKRENKRYTNKRKQIKIEPERHCFLAPLLTTSIVLPPKYILKIKAWEAGGREGERYHYQFHTDQCENTSYPK
jgi:hypothetical protein